ncbi:glycosyltransferase [Mumia flava]|nr:glycosyltransferase [Mumia flava]
MADRHLVLAMDSLDALGGVQRVLRQVGDGLADRGVRVELLGLFPDADPYVMPSRGLADEHVLVGASPTLLYSPTTPWRRAKLRVRGQGGGVGAFDRGVVRLRDYLAARPDAVVVATQLRSAEYLAAAGLGGRRFVVQYHDSYEAALLHRDVARLRRLARRAGAVGLLNETDRRAFERAGVAGTVTLRNPVDVTGLGRDGLVERREPVIVSGSRYDDQKALHVMIEAWSRVAPRHPGWRLDLYGDGPLRGPLAGQIDRLGVPARLCGPTDDLQGVFARSSVHALSSVHEGMGLVIAEAMCAGLPTVSTDAGAGVRELVRPGRSGVLVDVGDVDGFAAALDGLVGSPALRAELGAGARRLIEHHDEPRVLDEWAAFLAERW